MNTESQLRQFNRGVTLVELLITIAVIGSIVSIGIVAATKVKEGGRTTKLKNDVASINSAINVYLASGGSLDSVTGVDDILTKLKMHASAATAEGLVGLRGAMIDQRIRAVALPNPGGTTAERAVWDAAKQRFVVANSGAGVEEFILDQALADTTFGPEDRHTALEFAMVDDWVWDYEDFAPAVQGPLTPITTINPVTNPPTPPAPSEYGQLDPPTFSIPGGTVPPTAYPLSLVLTNHNAAGTSVVMYSVNGAAYIAYSDGDIITIAADYLTEVRAYSHSTNVEQYGHSIVAAETYETDYLLFTGVSDGIFANGGGSENLVESYEDDGHTYHYGEAAEGSFHNTLHFEGATFAEVEPGQQFLLGTLTYTNGTTTGNTHATHVELQMELDLTTPEVNEDFTFGFDLESTPNYEYQTEDENADFVRMQNFSADFETELNGITYRLEMEFGEMTGGGFTTIHEFHVHEEASASGSVYGRLVEVTEE